MVDRPFFPPIGPARKSSRSNVEVQPSALKRGRVLLYENTYVHHHRLLGAGRPASSVYLSIIKSNVNEADVEYENTINNC